MIDPYNVGPLLYMPAMRPRPVKEKCSIAFCLEDTVSEDLVSLAEQNLLSALKEIHFTQNLFIRVRSPEQMLRLWSPDLPISGFIFPKYSPYNADDYNYVLSRLNMISPKPVYGMPILETPDLVNVWTRLRVLDTLKAKVDSVRELILNIRVGGNDFCNQLGVRRHRDESIYDILPIASLLGDIISMFGRDYVISAPVNEYFVGDGLKREIQRDLLNGFVGKTVIHPNQTHLVNAMHKVSQSDYQDAKMILGWQDGMQVGKSAGGDRMNEVPTHLNWARRVMKLAEFYGVKEDW